MRVEGSNPVLAVHDLELSADEPWGRRELALRSPDGHRFMLGQALVG